MNLKNAIVVAALAAAQSAAKTFAELEHFGRAGGFPVFDRNDGKFVPFVPRTSQARRRRDVRRAA